MGIKKEKTDLFIDGQPVYTFELVNGHQTRVTLSNYGCIVLSWVVRDRNGEENDVVLGFDKVEDYLQEAYLENYPYFGAVIGRYAGRIRDARFRLNGKSFQLAVNKGLDHIHGGHRGFDRVVWKVHRVEDKKNRVVFRYSSPEGEEGYPGNLQIQFSCTLTEENELSLSVLAEADQATPVNITHHHYFNLENGRGKIDRHWLRIPADAYLEQDANLLVTGNSISVEGTFHDFRQGKRIGLHLPSVGEYDQSFVLNKKEGELGPAAVLKSRRSGLCLRAWTTEPICHLYTGKWIPAVRGKGGRRYGSFSGLCLETQHHPNALNIPAFPDTILRPGKPYRQKTIYKVSLEEEDR